MIYRTEVNFPTSSYPIIVEPGGIGRLVTISVTEDLQSRRCLLVLDAAVKETHGQAVHRALEAMGVDVIEWEIEAKESNKRLATVSAGYSKMLEEHLDRSHPVIAVGGGLTGDVAGFLAATYLRGVPLIQVPTTLLAMVDASIGGKTGVNFDLPSGTLGKNLVGAFWQPTVVIVDPRTLSTLSRRDRCCGLAECVKHAIIADKNLFDWIESQGEKLLTDNGSIQTELISRSIEIKVNIVQQDEREAGRRALLNLGHTFAHVIEPLPALDLLHGEAVAIGIVAACQVSQQLGKLPAATCLRIEQLLASLGLPIRLPSPVKASSLVEAMQFDKKVLNGVIRLIVPDAIGAVSIVGDIDHQSVVEAWHYVGAELA